MVEQSSTTALWISLSLLGVSLLLLAGAVLIGFRKSGGAGLQLLRWGMGFGLVLAAVQIAGQLHFWLPGSSENTLDILRATVLVLGGSLATWTLSSALAQRTSDRALRWSVFLVANGAWMLALSSERLSNFINPTPYDHALRDLREPGDDAVVEIGDESLFTDNGRPVAACRVDDQWHEALRASQTPPPELKLGLVEWTITQARPDQKANCHGWVFTGGRYIIRGRDVDSILLDNRYECVDQPRTGDLIVYRSTVDNSVLHTGIVRIADADLVLIESKWGLWGRYLHQPKHQPYTQNFVFYRSPRDGHLLARQPDNSSTIAHQRSLRQADRKKRIQLSCIMPFTSLSL